MNDNLCKAHMNLLGYKSIGSSDSLSVISTNHYNKFRAEFKTVVSPVSVSVIVQMWSFIELRAWHLTTVCFVHPYKSSRLNLCQLKAKQTVENFKAKSFNYRLCFALKSFSNLPSSQNSTATYCTTLLPMSPKPLLPTFHSASSKEERCIYTA